MSAHSAEIIFPELKYPLKKYEYTHVSDREAMREIERKTINIVSKKENERERERGRDRERERERQRERGIYIYRERESATSIVYQSERSVFITL